MAAPQFKTEIYTVDKLVESAGTILFRLLAREVCILHSVQRRRNLSEGSQDTAIRKTTEELGVPCYLLSVGLVSRVCPTVKTGDVPDGLRLFKSTRELIAMQQWQIADGEMKLIWWFLAAVDEKEVLRLHEKQKFEVEFHSYDEAVQA
ncbi:hypothetical protein M441DRAFT_68783 [Trichoderma asperellum CBS 433.97]|uniref:Nudix hydrolase domain-containing protein n=1 Tax=Trichoderma asperellum (strain ATCC 204424 / CBS 433.97 / NBRC 101777) TaxID=1042311 RepID=A0A2T3ZAD4_TRIA4|nr:hypothetical protein M441DRAFT_68783 [Trichoderma asperellum CBS 433.97]PTB41767.1 hypothetical protein M441DRAFT_68783 [Trichoderma asperellum CBS 433.97]